MSLSTILTTAAVLIMPLLSACGASLTAVGPKGESQRLRDFNRLYVSVASASGASSVDVATLGGLTSANTKEGLAQIALAKDRLAFQLRRIGFDVVSNPSSADAIAEFSIGAVRYDPLTGWIADEAGLVIRAADDNRVLASVFADSRWITPTVKTVVKRLADGVRKFY